MTKTGRIAVLLNIHEENDDDASRSPVSRGLFAKNYLSTKSNGSTKEWIENTVSHYGEDGLKQAGGFTLFCGKVVTDAENTTIKHEPFGLFSNRGGQASWVLGSASTIARDELEKHLDSVKKICVVTNGTDETWEKLSIGRTLVQQVLDKQDELDDHELVEELFAILSHDTYPTEDPTVYNLRKSVFIPTNDGLYNGIYGTRTQTVIMIDTEGKVKYIEKNLGKDSFSTEFKFRLQREESIMNGHSK